MTILENTRKQLSIFEGPKEIQVKQQRLILRE